MVLLLFFVNSMLIILISLEVILKSVMVLMIMKLVRHGQAGTDPPTGVERSKVEIIAVNYHVCIKVLLCCA